ncbi:hypothetical protein [Nostoc sp. DSM 114159]
MMATYVADSCSAEQAYAELSCDGVTAMSRWRSLPPLQCFSVGLTQISAFAVRSQH